MTIFFLSPKALITNIYNMFSIQPLNIIHFLHILIYIIKMAQGNSHQSYSCGAVFEEILS